MKYVARLKSVSELNQLRQLHIDVVWLDTKFSVRKIHPFPLFEIQQVALQAKELGMETYVSINKMIHESEIPSLKQFLKELQAIEIQGIIISDLTVHVLSKDLNLDHLIIFQPGTLNTDSYTLEYFMKHPLKGITISREITLAEIQKILKQNTLVEVSLVGHGYLDMFYSKRKLITNYFIHKGIKGKEITNHHGFRLNEEIREDDFYPIIEDEFGTHIFRSHKLISFQEAKTIKDNLSDFFFERLFMSDEEYFDSIRLYHNELDLETFLNAYKDYDSGFYFKPTEMIKGDSHES